MKYAIAASMMALGLAACGGGGGGKAEFVKKCVAESGQDQAVCECQSDAMEEAIGTDNFNKMVKVAMNDEDAAADMMAELVAENPDIAMKMAGAMMKCSPS